MSSPAYRATLHLVFVTASDFNCVRYFYHDCLVAKRTWLVAKSFLLEYQSMLFMAQLESTSGLVANGT